MSWSVYDMYGSKKYLNRNEIITFLSLAKRKSFQIYAFCRLLCETGCRISEGLAVSHNRLDLSGPTVIFESLKKRRRGIFRRVPISDELSKILIKIPVKVLGDKIWPWARNTAWRYVSGLLHEAGIVGRHACPKGLRHGFAVSALGAGAPLNLVQIWLGHANISTTSIYAVALGPEEREIAERVWTRLYDDELYKNSKPFMIGFQNPPITNYRR
ncbi:MULTISPECIES: tyrosine-type recombinase/integrase [unclassified Sphingobium]|uniref:tyrosine-type recombinase/integrase n=1 Tax=unclassified Sphingobium TaxID=2611147 RepID=UPI002224A248|nr:MULTISPECIES: site-specific integrase [unclassified Sphingobium]MCW2412722.1 integrase [Sphingobium sp. B8D3D]MCW2414980.1 integrase [Sphingobium sp. B8D3A]